MQHNKNIPDGYNILVVLPTPMGDAVLAAPALRYLRAGLPQAKITFLANPTVLEILNGADWSDEQIVLDKKTHGLMAAAKILRERKFDAVILMVNSFRSAMLVYLADIKNIIGYNRDGRGWLLTCPVPVFRLLGRFAPIPMIDYYQFLIDRAIEHIDQHIPPNELMQSAQNQNSALQLFTGERERGEIDELFKRWHFSDKEHPVIIVPGGAFGPSKCWPAERFAQVADKLTDDGYRVIISCAPDDLERDIARRITTTAKNNIFSLSDEKLSLSGLKELIRRCCLMVANDTGPCHIAAAFDVPLITLFGPTDPRWTATGYENEIRLRVNVDCGPCQRKTCSEDHRCLTEIQVNDVYNAAKKLLAPGNEKLRRPLPTYGAMPETYYSPFAESFEPLPDGNGLVHKNYTKLLRQNNLLTIEDVFASKEGEHLTKPGLGTRERIKLELTDDTGQKVVLYLKRYGSHSMAALLKRRLIRRSRAAAAVFDFTAGLNLAEKGVPVARPIAYGQQSNWLGEKRSFVIFEELPNADALERLMPRLPEQQKQYKLLQDKNELVRQIARLVRRLHENGFYHRDLYLSHIFLCRDRYDNERLCLIDLQRVFRPLIYSRRWRVKDLAQFYFSARDYFNETNMTNFFKAYFQSDVLSSEKILLIRAIHRKANRIAKHDIKRRLEF
ncbi:MAG: lipopolysaccharide heptosyltransferase II [Sedimentisphaerales bacterium]|nr:lipopolysaccharide heptosyltransferase II [Sedimentisphaerales bacterium]